MAGFHLEDDIALEKLIQSLILNYTVNSKL